MLFKDFISTLDTLEGITGRLEMIKVLSNFYAPLNPADAKLVSYLILGNIDAEYKGIVFGVSQAILINALSKSLRLDKKVIKEQMANIGDLGDVAEELFLRERKTGKNIQIGEIIEELKILSKVKSMIKKEEILRRIYDKLSPKEAKYVTRIIEGKLRVGVREPTIIDALASQLESVSEAKNLIRHAFYVTSDIGYVTNIVKNEDVDFLRNIKPKLGKPIIMMLAKALRSAEEILDKTEGKLAVEEKLDGLRLQAHISGNKIALWSRNLGNYNKQFPELKDELPEIINADKAILEGEIVAYDFEEDKILPFQLLTQRRGRKYEIDKMRKDIPIAVFWFDILYLDGQSLLETPYEERRKLLASVIKETDKHHLIKRQVVTTTDSIEEFFTQAIKDGKEGILAKRLDAGYTPGKRGDGWFKLKRDYQSQLADTLDCVVIGAFHGQGRRAGSYGSLLLGIMGTDGDFQTVCKMGSGLTDEIMNELPELFNSLKVEKPINLYYSDQLKPDIWLEPKLILEVEAAEISKSPTHTACSEMFDGETGLALRFPRFKRWREDKNIDQISTSEYLYSLWSKQPEFKIEEGEKIKPKRKKKTSISLESFLKKKK